MKFSREIFLSIRLLLALAIGLVPLVTEAAFFDLIGAPGAAIEGSTFGSVTIGGITATLTANSGILNQTSQRFGVNAAGSGDATDKLDGAVLAESITLTFDVDVLFQQFHLSVLSEGEEGALTIAGSAPVSLLDTGVGTDEFNYSSLVQTSESVVLAWVSGNGFSFDDFSVSLASALDGDFDADSDRDGNDFLVWQLNLGDAPSLALWESNYGVPAPLANLLAVPEPRGLGLICVFLLGLVVDRRRKIL